ncbi:hypothetical protein SDC9_136201 [bioreactor metagenome]|uniref:BioF2-like acetyltransferase domain-containing protein n=1 Tax=bioreactor metagenome TaxID=1076179 RepID=A0A645DJT7_9ZZZZ|nr:hypothetical protein [Candidatus Metalachnospira sp.]
MYTFQLINYKDIDAAEYNEFEDKLIFQTKEWISFIVETQKVTPIIIKIFGDDNYIGYYTGFFFKKFGIKIVGSPFRGWSTLYMGLNLKNNENRVDIVIPLWNFLKKHYHIWYMELIDRFITAEDAENAKLDFSFQKSYEKDISGEEMDVFKSLSSTCKNEIHRFERNEAIIREVEPTQEFAEKYYNQLKIVFGYQNLIPSYDLKRVQKLFEYIKEIGGALYCTEVLSPNGISIGTQIGFAYNNYCYLWGLTVIRDEQYYQSNTLLWDAIKHWKALGYNTYDMVGEREYKLKFHPYEIVIPRITIYRFKILNRLRDSAQKLYWKANKLKAKITLKK